METMTSQQRGPLVAGAILIIVGVAVLFGRQLALAVDWQVWPIVVGIAIFVASLVIGGNSGSGFAALGGIVTMAGVVLAVQRETGGYASWAYAWALVAPGGVGLGLLLYGLLTGQRQHVRGGFGALVAGVALFLVFFLFFEGVVGLNSGLDPDVVAYVVPILIIGLGILFVAGAFLAPLFSSPADEAMGWSSVAPSSGAASVVGSSGAGATSADDPAPVRSIDLGAVDSAEVSIQFGAGRLTIAGPADAGHLIDGTFRGGVRREDVGPGRVKLTTPSDRFWEKPWDRVPFEWRIGLTAEVPLRLAVETGAAKTEADLSELRVADLRVRTGAAETVIRLPRAAGMTRVDAQGGAAALRFSVPDGVGVTIRTQMALGTVDIDEARFPRDTQGGWASPDYAAAANKVELMLQGGLGSISVR